MAYIKATWYTIIENIRNFKLSVLYLIFPLLLILILGNALSGFFSKDAIKRSTVIFVDEKTQSKDDNFDYIRSNFKRFMGSDVFSSLFLVKYAKNKKEGLNLLNKYGACAAILIDKPDLKSMENKSSFKVEIIERESSIETSLLKSLIQNYLNHYKMVLVIESQNQIPVNKNDEAAIFKMDELKKGQYPRAIDYYAVTMLVMIILYGSFTGGATIEREVSAKTHIRLICSAKNLFLVFFSKGIGNFLFVYIQSVLVVVFSTLFFNVNWGDNLFYILSVIFIYQILIFEIGLLLRMFINKQVIIDSIVYAFAIISTFLIGGYVNFTISSQILQNIRLIFPNYNAQTLLFSLIYDPKNTTVISDSFFRLFIYLLMVNLISIIFIWRRNKWLYLN